MKATDISIEARLEEQTALLKEIKELLLRAEFEGISVFSKGYKGYSATADRES